ncbi:hypothetical protein BN946_scf185007.g291 [Trametes cinnabarina]|uniref:RlpA-like protein double-psi beta-barrel domain-containing protein n=1 Tax=Pycnoporus cinnabarinus TaxID=5643 RepID=A0A060SGB0_PYCCI|nr:hypothetical protein BN946_scf185007.g291 [Trametes cinnabarina]
MTGHQVERVPTTLQVSVPAVSPTATATISLRSPISFTIPTRVNPNDNPVCGRKITATYQGKSVTVAVTDRCTGCALTDLDFSPSAFSELADFDVGRLHGMTWVWAD